MYNAEFVRLRTDESWWLVIKLTFFDKHNIRGNLNWNNLQEEIKFIARLMVQGRIAE